MSVRLCEIAGAVGAGAGVEFAAEASSEHVSEGIGAVGIAAFSKGLIGMRILDFGFRNWEFGMRISGSLVFENGFTLKVDGLGVGY